MIISGNLGLIIWDSEEDDFEHSQLADNFVRIDAHSHLGGLSEALNAQDELEGAGHWTNLGLGLAIKTAAIEPASIWRYLIKERAAGHKQIDIEGVWSENIKEHAVENKHIKNEAVDDKTVKKETLTIDKFDPNILTLGSIILWYKYSKAAEPGDLWHVCDGTPWSAIPNGMGLTKGNIPDLRERFARGTDLNHTGEIGGSSSVDLAHHHDITSSALEHSHTVAAHNHVIAMGGKHNHTFAGGHKLHTRANAFVHGLTLEGHNNALESAYIAGYNELEEIGSDALANMDEGGEHNHGGTTSLSSAFATGGSSLSGSVETNAQLASVSVTPAYTGLVYLMRVF